MKETTPSKVTQYIDKYTEIDDTDVIRHIFAGNKRIASIDGAAAVTYNHEDHLGSSNIRTDATGSVIKSIEYLPFGEKRTQSGSYNTIKNRFTGQYEDEESDLYYYQQRYYDPTLSRFITADPLYLEEMEKRGTDAQETNVYAYVRNNPLNSIDPFGLEVYTMARPLNMNFPNNIGNHQFSVLIPNDPSSHKNLIDVGGGKQGVVIGAYNDLGVLKAMPNSPTDVAAAREFFNGVQGTQVQGSLVNSGGQSDAKFIDNILSKAENYSLNTSKNPISYPSEFMNLIGLGVNSTSFNQSLLNEAGAKDLKTDFSGYDSGSLRSVDSSSFANQPDVSE